MNKEVSEEKTAEIARDFFLGEFSFDELEYVPANLSKGDKKELADLIIDYGDKTIAFQIKGRRGDTVPGGDRKWVERKINDAKNQLVNTLEQYSKYEIPQFINGKGDSTPEEICWEKSDPKGLVDYINDKYEADSEERAQYRRVIRYMKRWKNLKFNSSGNAEPPSIGITLIAADKFEVSRTYDYLEEKWKYDDLEALIGFAKEIQNLFTFQGVSDNGRLLYRIKYPLPSSLSFEDDTDVFKKMTDIYMTDFKDKIDKLITDLEAVKKEVDEVEQCKLLNKIFGDDFKVPETKDASKKQMNYIPSSSSSGV